MVKVGDEEDGANAFPAGCAGHANHEVHCCIAHALHATI